jgi:hypothetical protein
MPPQSLALLQAHQTLLFNVSTLLRGLVPFERALMASGLSRRLRDFILLRIPIMLASLQT